jgi:hypothetical protein
MLILRDLDVFHDRSGLRDRLAIGFHRADVQGNRGFDEAFSGAYDLFRITDIRQASS